MVQFSEVFVGGFFGWRRTYGAAARIETKPDDFETDWQTVLHETAAWRVRRQLQATTLHLYFEVAPQAAWPTIAFVTERVLVHPATRPAELQNLRIEIAVFGIPDFEQYADLIIYPEPERV